MAGVKDVWILGQSEAESIRKRYPNNVWLPTDIASPDGGLAPPGICFFRLETLPIQKPRAMPIYLSIHPEFITADSCFTLLVNGNGASHAGERGTIHAPASRLRRVARG